MSSENNFHFDLLKKEVAATFLKHHHAAAHISEWKGEEIVLFQEDLFDKVKAKVSEKWFYTYFKKQPTKLPRIDMLNLLSAYVGLENWQTFKKKHPFQEAEAENSKNRRLKYIAIGVFLIGFLAWFCTDSKHSFEFCFVDDLQQQPIAMPLDIKIISQKESPVHIKTDSLGCFSYQTKTQYITFIVKSPYHKTDTIVRYIDTNKNQLVSLATDDYALMLKYYTAGNIKDWKKHKERLSNLIADTAVIYQFHSTSIGVELFSKQDFIRMLTIPTKGLQRIKILDRTFENGKITTLKFAVL